MIIAGLAFVQNLRRGHYELATETPRQLRVAVAFANSPKQCETWARKASTCLPIRQRNGALPPTPNTSRPPNLSPKPLDAT